MVWHSVAPTPGRVLPEEIGTPPASLPRHRVTTDLRRSKPRPDLRSDPSSELALAVSVAHCAAKYDTPREAEQDKIEEAGVGAGSGPCCRSGRVPFC